MNKVKDLHILFLTPPTRLLSTLGRLILARLGAYAHRSITIVNIFDFESAL